MKILSASVNWNKEWANKPEFCVTVDKIPDVEYIVKDNLYWGCNDGYVEYLYQSHYQEGFNGRSFILNMKDGSEVTLKGPWSSRASVCNSMGFIPCSEVVINGYRGNLTVDRLLECAKLAKCYLVMKAGEEIFPVGQDWFAFSAKCIGQEFSYYPSVSPNKIEKPTA